MKKKIIAIILAVFLISVIATGVVYGDEIFGVMTHRAIFGAYDDYPIQTKERGDYILESTRYATDNDVVVYSFVIKDKKSEEIVFECPDVWRSWDLKYIGFIGDGLDILVTSGDVGSTGYRYENGSWIEIYNPKNIDASQLGEDKAVFFSDDCLEYFDWVSDYTENSTNIY